ncbi:MAG: hypothetical protein GXW90_03255 [Tepidanaerobacter acetatoxydans]|uniref:hypothetical protein n=1 Tax=Tepidanaerobacter TaxID=499228 RepID=UPI000A5ECCCC|nr:MULTISPECIES: hypothetical protein [Tepidanaerobacter]NLU09958.1 hypothetical protein [Tepidanaerobacter acetatoxydans]
MSKYRIKRLSVFLAAVMLIGVVALPVKADDRDLPPTVYDKNGLEMRFERLGLLDTTQDKADPKRSGGPDGKAQLDSLTLYEQSTYAQKEPGRFYYRTVGYRVALLNGDFLNISDGLVPVNEKKIPIKDGLVYFPGKGRLDFQFALVNTQYERTKEFREESNANIKRFLTEKYQDAGFNTPCVSSIVLSREYLLKALGIENNPGLLDEARYLLRCGEVEFFQADAKGDEGPALDATGTKVYYNVFDRRFSTEARIPLRFKDCAKDVQSRMQIIDLNSGEIMIIGEEVNLKVENGWANISKGDKLNIGADVVLENNQLKKENGELPVKVILDWETKDGQKGHKETFINKIDVGESVPVDFKDSVKIPEGGKLEGTYKIVVNPDNEHPREFNFSDNTFEGTFSVEDGLDFSVRARANFIPVGSEDTSADIEVFEYR